MSDSATISLHDEKRSFERATIAGSQKSAGPSKLPAAPAPPPRVTFMDPSLADARKIYLKTLIGSTVALVLLIFAIFSIYWGALWKIPARALPGWVVDLDGGDIGSAVSEALLSQHSKAVAWQLHSASTKEEVFNSISEQHTWVAIVINSGASDALANAGGDYNGSHAVTVVVSEARNENAYRNLIRPTVTEALLSIGNSFALEHASADRLAASPQAVIQPISWTTQNMHPFDVPVASAITFVGLIYLLVLCFFMVIVGGGARMATGLEMRLTTASLIRVRLGSVIPMYFIISLFYSALSAAFQVDFSRKYGSGGFVIFWMVNFTGMFALGMGLESMITLLTPRFIPFFMISWIIVNVSTAFMPLEVLPKVYHYGYGFPFYNVSAAVRSIIFGTRNQLGLNFAVLISWGLLSCCTLVLFQWFRRREVGQKESADEIGAEIEEGIRTPDQRD